ncbi:MAG: hypothetical protein ACR2RB_00080, partial [Gammaproteobacteria bacterium]
MGALKRTIADLRYDFFPGYRLDRDRVETMVRCFGSSIKRTGTIDYSQDMERLSLAFSAIFCLTRADRHHFFNDSEQRALTQFAQCLGLELPQRRLNGVILKYSKGYQQEAARILNDLIAHCRRTELYDTIPFLRYLDRRYVKFRRSAKDTEGNITEADWSTVFTNFFTTRGS